VTAPVRAEGRQERVESVGEWRMRVVSYRLGDTWTCVIDNVDPGAVIARAHGASREAAEAEAEATATRRLERTRVTEP